MLHLLCCLGMIHGVVPGKPIYKLLVRIIVTAFETALNKPAVGSNLRKSFDECCPTGFGNVNKSNTVIEIDWQGLILEIYIILFYTKPQGNQLLVNFL